MSINPSQKTLNPADGQGKSGRGGYNNTKLKTDPISKPNRDVKCEQTHTVSGYDLSKYLEKEKQYVGLMPMERFLHQGGSSLERNLARKVPKGFM